MMQPNSCARTGRNAFMRASDATNITIATIGRMKPAARMKRKARNAEMTKCDARKDSAWILLNDAMGSTTAKTGLTRTKRCVQQSIVPLTFSNAFPVSASPRDSFATGISIALMDPMNMPNAVSLYFLFILQCSDSEFFLQQFQSAKLRSVPAQTAGASVRRCSVMAMKIVKMDPTREAAHLCYKKAQAQTARVMSFNARLNLANA